MLVALLVPISELIIELARLQLGKISRALRQRCISICGVIALISPLMLWMSWSPTVFWTVLTVWITALAIIFALIWSSPDERI